MTAQMIAQWLYDLPISLAIRESDILFPYIECVHVLSLVMVFGSIAAIDLRLLGLASSKRPISALLSEFLPYTWVAFVVAVSTGSLMALSNAVEYLKTPYFLIKMALLLLAGLNMMVFHFATMRTIAQWDRAETPPLAVRLTGGLSLLLWVGVIVCGRKIGFYIEALNFR